MHYALVNIENNIVENVIVLEDGVVWSPPNGFIHVPLANSFGVGDTWDGSQFIKQLPPVPDSISEGVQDVIG